MSKYTTEVRYICEEAAGLDASVGLNDVNNVVEAAYPKIFDSSLVFYNEETKTRLLPKILIHYYMREIGFETVGQWKLKLNQKMREILPYYNQLYASEALVYDPLKNVDNTHTHAGNYADNRGGSSTQIDNRVEARDLREDRALSEVRDLTTVDDGRSSFDHNEDTTLKHTKTIERGAEQTVRGNDKTSHAVDNVKDHWIMFSDTPQGGIDGVQLAGGAGSAGTTLDNAYLTNVTHETESPAATHDTVEHGNVTNTYGDVVETYNKNNEDPDNVHADGWDKVDNTNVQTGTIDNTGNVKNTGTITNTGSTTNQKNEQDTGTEAYENREAGKIGVMTYQEMQMKWRESFLNIDLQIIGELDDLFMKVW